MKNKCLLTLFVLLLCSSCEFIPGISNEESNQPTIEKSNQPTIEDSLYNSEIVSEEIKIEYNLSLIKDFNITQDDIIAKAVISGSLKDAGCYEVIKFSYANTDGYLYTCKVKGFAGNIIFQTGIYDNIFLGYVDIENNESSGRSFIEKLTKELGNKPNIDLLIENSNELMSGTSRTGTPVIKCLKELVNHYKNIIADDNVYGDPLINYIPKEEEPSQEEVIELHVLQEYGLILQESHQIKEISNEKYSHVIIDSSNNEVAYVYKITQNAQVELHGYAMAITVICYVAINNNNEIYSIAIESATTKNYALSDSLPSWANETYTGKTLEELTDNSEIMSGATISSNEIKNAIIEAFNIHNS